jgi:uncharacterized lipoprotein YmbA
MEENDMTTGCLKFRRLIFLSAAMLLLIACGKTAPTRFYVLHPMADARNASRPAPADDITLAVLPVNMPEHLNRSQIVTRQSRHAVTVDEFNRWAEPLDASFTMILAENLSLLLNSNRISVLSRLKFSRYDYHLKVDIIRFDGQIGGEAGLTCRWSLFSGDEKSLLVVQRSDIKRPVQGNDYQGLVETLSRIAADLSQEIADRILTLERAS